jgi:hypothetical protein
MFMSSKMQILKKYGAQARMEYMKSSWQIKRTVIK